MTQPTIELVFPLSKHRLTFLQNARFRRGLLSLSRGDRLSWDDGCWRKVVYKDYNATTNVLRIFLTSLRTPGDAGDA